MSKTRNSSLELLRIISMLFIICSHFCVHGGFDIGNTDLIFNRIILQVGALGNLGVDIFVMISGYFLSQTRFKLSRVVKVVLQVLFYSVSIYLILAVLNVIPFTVKDTIKSVLPILLKLYWFATVYVILCVLTPFLNKLLNGLTKNQYIAFLGVILFIWSVIPTFTTINMYSNEIIQFVMLYSIGAFVRKYPDISFAKKYRYWITFVSAFLLVMSTVAFNLLAQVTNTAFYNHGNDFYTRYSVLTIALAYGLLLIFTNLKNISNYTINLVSSTTFGIYLIHDNRYLREVIWNDIFRVNEFSDKPYLVLYLLACVIIIFIVCATIDYIRQKLFEKPVMHFLEPVLNCINDKLRGFTAKKKQPDTY